MTPTWIQMFLDVPRAAYAESVAFWAAATEQPSSPARGEDGQFVTLVPAEGSAWIKLQAIDGDFPRIHLDLDSPDRPTALARSTALGASHAWTYAGVPVMRSPGGLLFCHTIAEPGSAPHLARNARSVLDQICLDISPDHWDAEVDFWRELTGRSVQRGLRPEFVFLGGSDADPRILLQRRQTDDGPTGAHPDFAVADRAAEVARHLALGAARVADEERWTVLEAPSGQRYCLTDRDPATGRVRRT